MDGPTPLDLEVARAVDAVRADAGLRDLLRAARSWGVPPARFLGRSMVELRAELDERGRPVRYVATPWELRDVALVLALQEYEADTCSGCGHQLSETTDRANDGRYTVGLPVRCHACTALAPASEKYRDNQAPDALRFPVHLRPPVPLEALPPLDAEVPT